MVPRGCDRKEEKEPEPMMVEWGGWRYSDRILLRGGLGDNTEGREEGGEVGGAPRYVKLGNGNGGGSGKGNH